MTMTMTEMKNRKMPKGQSGSFVTSVVFDHNDLNRLETLKTLIEMNTTPTVAASDDDAVEVDLL
jgi:hypothetical protein